MNVLVLALAILTQAGAATGPETYQVNGTIAGEGAVAGSVTVTMTLRLDEYSPERARAVMTDALKYRGYPGFLLALREAPIVGSLDIGDQKFMIRWAHQVPSGAGRTITIVTDTPIFFFGARKPGAKSTKGYEVAVMKIEVNEAGRGDGTMAAAARIKPDGSGGVILDQYAETPLKLTVARAATR
jgi:hypothetical protein